jgi:hypothetical protein
MAHYSSGFQTRRIGLKELVGNFECVHADGHMVAAMGRQTSSDKQSPAGHDNQSATEMPARVYSSQPVPARDATLIQAFVKGSAQMKCAAVSARPLSDY